MIYTLSERKYNTVKTNIQLTLNEHLPVEHTAVLDRINSLQLELGELNDYREYLERVASACEICIVADRQGGEDADRSSVSDKEHDEYELSYKEKFWGERADSVEG